ncbi:MAG: Dps family protein [Chitinophagales bacterium]
MKPNIGISDKNLKNIATLLNTLLADEVVLYIKTRQAHWNYEGDNFHEMHKFFESQYEQLDEIMDDVAERVRQLGHFASGSLKDYVSLARLMEDKTSFSDQKASVSSLLNDHETLIRIIRSDVTETNDKYKDLGTADFLTGLMEQHEKMAWMLRAYLS